MKRPGSAYSCSHRALQTRGAFDDPYFAAPAFSVWEERKHDWVEIIGPQVEYMD